MNPGNDQNNGSFFDGKTLIAIVLVGAVWMGWQSYLTKKYPDAYKQKAEQAQQVENNKAGEETASTKAVQSDNTEKTVKTEVAEKPTPAVDFKERILIHEDETWRLELSSRGMGFKGIYLKKYTDRADKPIAFEGKGYLPFETNLVGRQAPINFNIKKTGDNQFFGRAEVRDMIIEKTLTLNPSTYTIDVGVNVKNIKDEFGGLVNFITLNLKEVEQSLLMPTFDQQEFFTAHSGTTDREYLHLDNPYRAAFGQVHIASLSEQYFTLAMVDSSKVIPELNVAVDPATKTALAKLTHPVINRSSEYQVQYKAFAGPKDVDIMEKLDPLMTEIIDFGWFSWLAIILFHLLQWFYSVFGNYGIAIVLLTILVRIFVLPFHMMSYKSMRGMQEIQPQLKAIREKYKEDSQKMQQETMALMKENKVNPMGGCLPMLLQFPVFIALYRMFGQTIELYKAPMGFWIHDLSLKDPYYILPVVMGAVFFLQTKLTPSTMDPNQQKIMMIMPIMFAFFMAGLPSALTLYMCVSTIFGCAQQMYVMRDKRKTAAIKEAKA